MMLPSLVYIFLSPTTTHTNTMHACKILARVLTCNVCVYVSTGSRSDFLKELMSSIDFSNAMIGFGIAFLGATVVYIASKSSQRNDYIVWQLIMWLVEVSFATTILGLALNAMGYLLVL